jgi:hypothetical protein
MRILGWLVIIALALVAGFAAMNWTAFMAPTTLSLVAFDVYAPLGGIMLAALLVLTLLALAFAASWRTSMLLESRRLTRELQTQRELADRAEASRVAELGERLEAAIGDLKAASEAVPKSVHDRLDALDGSLRQAMGAAVSNLSTAIGTLNDKLDKAMLEPAARS